MNTIKYRKQPDTVNTPHDVLEYVYNSMLEKGYDPVDQLVG